MVESHTSRLLDDAAQELAEAMPDGVVIVDHDGTIIYANAHLAQLVKYHPAELIGKPIEVLVPAAMRDAHLGYRDTFTQHPHRRSMSSALSLVARARDGENVPVEISLSPITVAGIPYVVASVRDVSERKRLEARVLQTQKMESLGLLTGGVAHDFNNLLMPIMGYVAMARGDLPTESPVQPYLLRIESAAKAAADLVAEMLTYAGQRELEHTGVDLSALVESMAHILEATISKRAVLAYNFSSDLPKINADASQLRQVIMNLIMNASDAVGERSGRVTVTTGQMHIDDAYVETTYLHEPLPAGAYAYLEVSDTGVGMDDDTLAHIFDPFFTTKAHGRGLGMAGVLGIVRSHNGAVKIYSEPGRGTTVKMLFPLPASVIATETPRPLPGFGVEGITVLVADDDAGVRAVTQAILERAGIEVVTAVDGTDAIRALQQNSDRISVVLLDYTMPGPRAPEVLRELRRIRPDVPVVLSSGYAEDDATASLGGRRLSGYLQKPYTPDTLLSLLSEILVDRAKPPGE